MKTLLPVLLLMAACDSGTSGTKGGAAAGYVVVNSDFMMSTAISLVGAATATLAQDDCLDSGSAGPSLSMALSSDVVLPSQTQLNDQLVLVDRKNSALDILTPSTCKVARQISVATGFYSNPHDVVSVSATKSYVTRYSANATPSGTAGANDQGSDVLIINPQTGTVTGRIDLSSYATTATGATLLPLPDRAILIGTSVFVSLNEESADFMHAGPARVMVIDTNKDAVSATIDLPNNKNCSGLDYLAASKTLLVGCVGDYNDSANQAAQSGVVMIDLSGATPTVTKTLGPSVFGGKPFGSFGAIGDEGILVITVGDFTANTPDSLWAYSLASSTAAKVVDGDAPYVFNSISYDGAHAFAFVADASATTPVVRVFDVGNPAAVLQKSTFVSNPKSGLPPRFIAAY